jgi:hypothetical protein
MASTGQTKSAALERYGQTSAPSDRPVAGARATLRIARLFAQGMVTKGGTAMWPSGSRAGYRVAVGRIVLRFVPRTGNSKSQVSLDAKPQSNSHEPHIARGRQGM